MEKELYTAARPVEVDVNYAGFNVTSKLQLGGGSSCSSGSCSSGGCGTGAAGGSCNC
jgi:hypothetical protein